MTPRSREFLERLALGTCTDLMAAYGIGMTRQPATALESPTEGPDTSSGGLVRFSGDMLQGSILFVASFEFLTACRPIPLRTRPLSMASATDWILVRDWSMELANQLVGRMRNRLYEYGVALDIKCPTAVSSLPLSVSVRGQPGPPLQFLASGKHALRVWLDASAGPAFEKAILNKPNPPPTIPKEGEAILL
jgi:hypothetical protein